MGAVSIADFAHCFFANVLFGSVAIHCAVCWILCTHRCRSWRLQRGCSSRVLFSWQVFRCASLLMSLGIWIVLCIIAVGLDRSLHACCRSARATCRILCTLRWQVARGRADLKLANHYSHLFGLAPPQTQLAIRFGDLSSADLGCHRQKDVQRQLRLESSVVGIA